MIFRYEATLFQPEEEKCCKPARINNAFNTDYIKYKSNADKNKALSIKEYLCRIRVYLKTDIINNFKKSDTWTAHLTRVIDFIFYYSKSVKDW